LGRPRRGCDNNIKMDSKERQRERLSTWTGFAYLKIGSSVIPLRTRSLVSREVFGLIDCTSV
jgi:hypothetical protein